MYERVRMIMNVRVFHSLVYLSSARIPAPRRPFGMIVAVLLLSLFTSQCSGVARLPLLKAEKSHQLHSLEEEGGEDYEFNRRGPLSSNFAYVSTPWKKGTHPDESEDLFDNNVFLPDLGAPEAKTKPGPKTPPDSKPGPKAQPSAKKEAEEIPRSGIFLERINHFNLHLSLFSLLSSLFSLSLSLCLPLSLSLSLSLLSLPPSLSYSQRHGLG
jgi:hypothetical protein